MPDKGARVTAPLGRREVSSNAATEYLFSAKGAFHSQAWGNAPGIDDITKPSALKARLNATWNESRLQRWRFCVTRNPGAMPQAADEVAPSALNTSATEPPRQLTFDPQTGYDSRREIAARQPQRAG